MSEYLLTPKALSDRFFIPMVVFSAAGLVWAAMQYRPLAQDPLVTETRFIMERSALAQLIPGPGTEVVFDPAAPGGPIARVTATASLEAAGALSAGVGAVIPPEFEARLPGRTIDVEIAITSADAELAEVAIGYFTVGSGDSGWRMRTIGVMDALLTLRHEIPADAPLGNNDWVGLWPDPQGAGRTVSVRRIEVRILSEPETP